VIKLDKNVKVSRVERSVQLSAHANITPIDEYTLKQAVGLCAD